MASFLRKHYAAIILVFTICFGVYFRFRFIEPWVWEMVGYDESRDMLVARHIVDYSDFIFRGPLSAGSKNILMNSPVYYYIVAIFWFIGRSPLAVMILWAGIMTTPIYIGYYIGKKIWDPVAGLCLAMLIAVHPEFVMLSKQIGQPMLIPVWLLTVFLIFLIKKKVAVVQMIVFMSFVFLSLHIHYGAFSIFPVIFFWFVFWWLRHTNESKIYAYMYIGIISELLFLLWVFFTFRFSMFDQLSFFSAYSQRNYSSFLSVMAHVIHETLALAYPGVHPFWISAIMMAGILVLIFQIISKKTNLSAKSWYSGLLVSLIFPVIFIGFYNGHISPTYLYSLLVVVIIVMAFVLRLVYGVHRLAGVLCIITALLFFGKISLQRTTPPTKVSHFIQHKEVARAIYTDYQSIQKNGLSKNAKSVEIIPSFVLATLSISPYLVYDGWGTGATWYWLEDFFDQKLVTLTNTVTNFYPLVSNPKYFYVICDHRYVPSAGQECIDRFAGARDYVSKTYTEVYRSENYIVWRYGIIFPPKTSYNIAYPDLLNPDNK